MLVILAAVLAVIGGYLLGTELERDRQRRARRVPANPLQRLGNGDELLSDREWERFVAAVHAAADGSQR